jgi:hypothetical protein
VGIAAILSFTACMQDQDSNLFSPSTPTPSDLFTSYFKSNDSFQSSDFLNDLSGGSITKIEYISVDFIHFTYELNEKLTKGEEVWFDVTQTTDFVELGIVQIFYNKALVKKDRETNGVYLSYYNVMKDHSIPTNKEDWFPADRYYLIQKDGDILQYEVLQPDLQYDTPEFNINWSHQERIGFFRELKITRK